MAGYLLLPLGFVLANRALKHFVCCEQMVYSALTKTEKRDQGGLCSSYLSLS